MNKLSLRKLQFSFISAIFILSLALCSSPLAYAETSGTLVELTLREQYGISRNSVPVSSGVPLTKSITSMDNLRLLKKVGDAYVEIPAQFRVLERWDGKKRADDAGYIHWVLVDFQADATPLNKSNYYLEFGPGVIRSSHPEYSITTSETQDQIIVDTGKAIFTINKKGFNLFESVVIEGQELVQPDPHYGAVIKDSYNDRYYISKNVKKAIIEEQGPLRTALLIKGGHGNDSGAEKEFYGYTTRIQFYAGKSMAKVDHTITNNPLLPPAAPQPARGALAFKDYSLITRLNLSAGNKQYMLYGENESAGTIAQDGNVYLYQDSSGGDNWHNDWTGDTSDINSNDVYGNTHFRGYKIFKDGVELEQHDRAFGIADVSDSSKGLTVGIDKFWQLFPKKIQLKGDGEVIIGLLPEEFTEENVYYHWIEDMGQVNTEVFYDFHAGAYNETIRNEIIDRIHPLFAVCSPNWYAEAEASSLPGGSIYPYQKEPIPRIKAGYGGWTWITMDEIHRPLIDQLLDYRDNYGLYSAYYYGERTLNDKNGSNFEGPVEFFINFFQTGIVGSSTDMHQYYFDGNRPFVDDYNYLEGGIDFAKHWMHNRANNLDENWQREDYSLIERGETKEYFFAAAYPKWGGRVGSDPIHTRSELPKITSKGISQPSRDWFYMDEAHVVQSHIVDYWHLTGDMAVLEWAHSSGELLENYLGIGFEDIVGKDIREDGVLDSIPTSGTAIRAEAWPVLGLAQMYTLTEDGQYLNYAIQKAKAIMYEQNLEKGYHTTANDMSEAQMSKAVLAFGKLYELTGNEDYFDRSNGYMNFLVYYAAAPTGYLNGYGGTDELGNPISYPQRIIYYDSYHHQPALDPKIIFGLSSSSARLNYPLAWLYRYAGNPKYKWLLDINYDTYGSPVNGEPTWQALSPWLEIYLHDRFHKPKPDVTPPEIITDLSVENTKNMGEVRLTWTAPADESGLLKYQVKYARLPMVEQMMYPDEAGIKTNFWAAANVEGEPIPSNPGEPQSMMINGLAPDTRYFFAIRCYDIHGNRSDVSTQPSEIPNTSPPDTTAPSKPALTATVLNEREIQLAWTVSTDAESGIERYDVYRDGAKIKETTQTQFLDSGLSEATAYSYYVAALNKKLMETLSDTVTQTTLGDTHPPEVVSVATISLTLVEIKFSEPVNKSSAENTGNYAIDRGVIINNAALSPDGYTVYLSTTEHESLGVYVITIQNIWDRASTPNELASYTTSYKSLIEIALQRDSPAPFLGIPSYQGCRDAFLYGDDPGYRDWKSGAANYLLKWDKSAREPIIAFDLSVVPGNLKIVSAELLLNTYGWSYPTGEPNLFLYRVTKNWVENDVTYNQYSEGKPWDNPGGDKDTLTNFGFGPNGIVASTNVRDIGWLGDPASPVIPADGGWITFDITTIAQAWRNGEYPNYGLIMNSNVSNNGVYFRSSEYTDVASRPKLVVRLVEQIMPTILYGDISGNGEISAADASLAVQYAVGLITLTPEQVTKADVSGNGEVGAADASLIAQYAVGLIDTFPAEG